MDRGTTQHAGSSLAPRTKRRRTRPSTEQKKAQKNQSTQTRETSSESPCTSPPEHTTPAEQQDPGDADYEIRANNAYPGSTNSIGSVHQRRWFITLDRPSSGFVEEAGSGPGKNRWIRRPDLDTGEELGFEPFYVRGPGVERSVVTGRLERDILQDEKVEGFVPRRGWRAVLG